ncbi:unnamed protein product [Ilex paraguariensis]|uniref:Uncharacterized protein n=1 Tax=Ilex paraguariensis TaxID=185542 RepID=A0ABC8RAR5_9AQUA
MVSLGAILKHPDDLYPMLKLKMAARHAEKQIPPEPHWGFCYTMLLKVSRSFAFVIQQLGTELRNAVSRSFAFVIQQLGTELRNAVSLDPQISIDFVLLENFYGDF